MTCYLSLPHFYYNLKFNNCLVNFIHKNPESKICNFNIESFYGSFPFVSWNGDITSNFLNNRPLPMHDDYFNFLKKSSCLLRFDMTNPFLQDYNDIHSNIILKMCEDGNNQIEISDYELYKKIKENFPNYYFIYNNKYKEEIDFISEDILYIHDFYKKTLKSNIEITLGEKCSCNSKQKIICLLQENSNQMNFSGKSIYNKCDKLNNYNNLELRNELNLYLSKGIKHFKIDSPAFKDLNNFNKYLIKNLLKEEYEKDFWKYYNSKE